MASKTADQNRAERAKKGQVELAETAIQLRVLICDLRADVRARKMTTQRVDDAVSRLAAIGYMYDYALFPVLRDTNRFVDTSGETPTTLAEALLWKLGKWKSYKNFSRKFANQNETAGKTDIVFFAFAQHLRNPSFPIFDQHALRALWAICTCLTAEEIQHCRNWLMNGKGQWRKNGSGSSGTACYKLFKKHVADIITDGVSHRDLDLLLMPLGQFIKKVSSDQAAFNALCDFCKN